MSMLRTYDDWRASGPHEDMPNAEIPQETCEHCAGPVAAVKVSWCFGCHRWSYRPDRPEHEHEKGDDDGSER